MIRSGRVISCQNRSVVIELDNMSSCGDCTSSGCSAQLFFLPNSQITVPAAENSLDIGERVRISVPEPGLAWLVMLSIAYGIPILGLIGGAVLGAILGSGEAVSILCGVGGFIGGLFAWHLIGKTPGWSTSLRLLVRGVRIVEEDQLAPIAGPY